MAIATFLPKCGGYRDLRVYRLTEIIYDLSVLFVKKYIPKGSRTKDQMEQAARSGKQNIAEGSVASATSKEIEIKLTNVAKASLEELLLDYEDYLRQHSLERWDKNHPRTRKLRIYLRSDEFIAHPLRNAERLTDDEFCKMSITLIKQSTYKHLKLLETQQRQFLANGGIKELMYRARVDYRSRH